LSLETGAAVGLENVECQQKCTSASVAFGQHTSVPPSGNRRPPPHGKEEAGGQEPDPECKLCGRCDAGGKRVGRGAVSQASSAADTSDNQPQRSIADDGELLSQCEDDGNSVHGCAVPSSGGQAIACKGGRPTTMRAGDSGDLPPGSLGLSIRGECVHAVRVRPANREVCRDWASFTTGENRQDAGSYTPDEGLGATACSVCASRSKYRKVALIQWRLGDGLVARAGKCQAQRQKLIPRGP